MCGRLGAIDADAVVLPNSDLLGGFQMTEKHRNAVISTLAAAVALALAPLAVAQPFANARTSRAGFVGGDLKPATACEQLNTRGIADVVEIAARTVAAEGSTPQHCRVS